MDDEESTNTYVTIGYQESHIECSLLNYESLHDIEANSTYVDGVEVNGIDWINGAGSATGNSTLLQRIEITVGPEDNNNLPGNTDNGRWLDELFQGLSINRYTDMLIIEQFRKHPASSTSQLPNLGTVIRAQLQILHLHFEGFDMGPIFESFGSSLAKYNDSQLKRFTIAGCRVTDEQAAVLIDSLFQMRHLLEFNFYANRIESVTCAYPISSMLCETADAGKIWYLR
jgi:hypothetical protein